MNGSSPEESKPLSKPRVRALPGRIFFPRYERGIARPLARCCVLLIAMFLLTLPAVSAADPGIHDDSALPYGPSHPALNDAWIKGKVDMALLLNPYLNSFRISTRVVHRQVTLLGKVNAPMDRKLAGQITAAIGGVGGVNNRLKVRTSDANGHRDSAGNRMRDVTLTAAVKNRLILSKNIDGEVK